MRSRKQAGETEPKEGQTPSESVPWFAAPFEKRPAAPGEAAGVVGRRLFVCVVTLSSPPAHTNYNL